MTTTEEELSWTTELSAFTPDQKEQVQQKNMDIAGVAIGVLIGMLTVALVVLVVAVFVYRRRKFIEKNKTPPPSIASSAEGQEPYIDEHEESGDHPFAESSRRAENVDYINVDCDNNVNTGDNCGADYVNSATVNGDDDVIPGDVGGGEYMNTVDGNENIYVNTTATGPTYIYVDMDKKNKDVANCSSHYENVNIFTLQHESDAVESAQQTDSDYIVMTPRTTPYENMSSPGPLVRVR